MDTTPLWLIGIVAVIVILTLIYLEMRHQRRGGGTHYQQTSGSVYQDTRDAIKKVESGL